MPIPILSVYGTFGGDYHLDEADPCHNPHHWWHATSAWWAAMRRLDCAPFSDQEFAWSGDLNGLGVDNVFRPVAWEQVHTAWFAGGKALQYFLQAHPTTEPFVVVAHSHAGQVALHAAAFGARIPILITVATPARSDMTAVIDRALPHIGRWIHVCDRHRDVIGQLGALSDGTVSFSREQPRATKNILLDGIDHVGLVEWSSCFHHWQDQILGATGLTERTA